MIELVNDFCWAVGVVVIITASVLVGLVGASFVLPWMRDRVWGGE